MQATESSCATLRFGVFEADVHAGELRKHGIRIKLQEQPFQILALLLTRPGELVTREELRQKLWPADTFVDFDRGLNKAMTKLRAALGDSAGSPRYVETLHRRGYRFLVPVSAHHEDWRTGIEIRADEKTAVPRSGAAKSGPPVTLGRAWFVRHKNISIAAAIVLICAAGGAYLRVYHAVAFGSPAVAVAPRHSVAVLGFRNLSGNPQDAWLSTALSDWLITELSAGDELRTIPAETVARMKIELALPDADMLGRDTLARIRSNIATDYVVAGSYATMAGESGGQMRLDLRLQDARSGETLVATSESGTESHLFEMIAKGGEELRSKLGAGAITDEQAAEVATALPSKAAAARLYWEGLSRLRVFDALAAHDLLSKAVAAEPNFALSHSALASAWSQLGYDENARVEAKKAFDLSQSLPRPSRLLVEARYRETSKDWRQAIEIYRALFEFFPDNLDYGLALAADQVNAGEGKEALSTVAALRTLPAPVRDDPRIDLANGQAAESLGDFKTVEACTVRAAEKTKAAGALLLLARARLDQAWAYENLGQFDAVDNLVREAEQLYEAAHDRKGVADAVTIGAIALEMQGDYLGAKKEYEESLSLYRELGGELGVANESDNLADVLLGLGDVDGARKSYESALAIYQRIGHPDGVPLAKNGLGDVFLMIGNHQEARKMYEESLAACQQIGDRSKAGVALSGLGRVYRVEGDLASAKKSETQAKAIFDEIGDKTQAMESRVQLAEILLDQANAAEAESAAREAADFFAKTRAKRDQAAAYMVLSRALLSEGRLMDARAMADLAVNAAQEAHHHELEMMTSVVSLRVLAATEKREDAGEAKRRLNTLIADACDAGFVGAELEARLALAEVEEISGDRAAARAQLDALDNEATAHGYRLIAQTTATMRTVDHRTRSAKAD